MDCRTYAEPNVTFQHQQKPFQMVGIFNGRHFLPFSVVCSQTSLFMAHVQWPTTAVTQGHNTVKIMVACMQKLHKKCTTWSYMPPSWKCFQKMFGSKCMVLKCPLNKCPLKKNVNLNLLYSCWWLLNKVIGIDFSQCLFNNSRKSRPISCLR